jgi:hemerythrin
VAQFKWQDRYDLGIDKINDEHHRLLKLMDQLEDAVKSNASSADQLQIMNSLAAFTQQHFSDEESYMESIAFPGLTVHRAIHKQLLDKVAVHLETLRRTGKVADDLFSFLSMWLSAHICGIDIQYAKHHQSMKKAS